jgi:hypothetical protein
VRRDDASELLLDLRNRTVDKQSTVCVSAPEISEEADVVSTQDFEYRRSTIAALDDLRARVFDKVLTQEDDVAARDARVDACARQEALSPAGRSSDLVDGVSRGLAAFADDGERPGSVEREVVGPGRFCDPAERKAYAARASAEVGVGRPADLSGRTAADLALVRRIDNLGSDELCGTWFSGW